MAETKIGLSQLERPAPLWYRRLSNALIIFIIPGLVALVQGWGLSDAVANRWLLVLAFIPAVLKGIGVLLGNGQDYTNGVIKAAAILIFACAATGCTAVRQTTNTAKVALDSTSKSTALYFKTATQETVSDTGTTEPDTAFISARVSSTDTSVFRQIVRAGAITLDVTGSPMKDGSGAILGREWHVQANKASEKVSLPASRRTTVTESGSRTQTAAVHQEEVVVTKTKTSKWACGWMLIPAWALVIAIILLSIFKKLSL